MPAKPPLTARDRVYEFLQKHSGSFFRCADIAKALDLDTHPVAVSCHALQSRGRVIRIHGEPTRPGGKPPTLYGAGNPMDPRAF